MQEPSTVGNLDPMLAHLSLRGLALQEPPVSSISSICMSCRFEMLCKELRDTDRSQKAKHVREKPRVIRDPTRAGMVHVVQI